MDAFNEGFVTDITWRETTIKTLANSIIIIPNAKVAAALVVNYTLTDKEVAVQLEIGVAYTSDLNNVERVTIETARETMQTIEGGVPDFIPNVRFHTFDKSSINFTVTMRAQEFADLGLVRHEFVKKLQQRFQDEEIEIPFPTRNIVINRKNTNGADI
jgi:small-conductance mechanosensitive channel